jgi:RimJ/RimL family protein N-acetyltransferase
VILRGERVLLRAFRSDEADLLVANRVVRGGPPQRLIESSGAWAADGFLRLAIEVDGRLVGDIQARNPPRALPPGVYELGIDVFDTDDRGRGLGREAVTLLVDHLFADPETGRVQLSTDVANAAMRRVSEVLGFQEEGVMRGFMPEGDGSRSDYVLYAVTREDWAGR